MYHCNNHYSNCNWVGSKPIKLEISEKCEEFYFICPECGEGVEEYETNSTPKITTFIEDMKYILESNTAHFLLESTLLNRMVDNCDITSTAEGYYITNYDLDTADIMLELLEYLVPEELKEYDIRLTKREQGKVIHNLVDKHFEHYNKEVNKYIDNCAQRLVDTYREER